jgi:hypothetical protein
MLVTGRGDGPGDGRPPLRVLWDDVMEFVIRRRLGLSPGEMANLFPADWDALYQRGLSPEAAVRLVVWEATLADLLDDYGATRHEFRFDFERAFYDGYSPGQAVRVALGLAAYRHADLRSAPAP